ncbi:protein DETOXIFICATION 2 [Citrus sinensis]|uniref:Protein DETOXIFICATION 2 n=1 Tax=Citrus sinensis TaxID=2711 RepID=A0ACB8K249_CITSI|nr:protein DETOXIFICATION 2 [Citrus sinensis]
MEEPLLGEIREEETKWVVTRGAFVEELKKLSFLAAPMVGVTVSQYLLPAVSLMMAGHLGELTLASVAIATSFTNVTGIIPLTCQVFMYIVFIGALNFGQFGFACALETLCGQAYGAKHYQQIGTYTYSAMFFCIAICFPISVLWIFMDKVLILLGQDPEIATGACNFSISLIPALLAFAVLRPLIHNLQSQSLILPLFLSACATLCFHILLCWYLVFKANFRIVGAALAIGLSYCLNAVILALYMRYSSSCEKTRVFIFSDIFSCIKEFFSFALPTVVMFCLTISSTHYFIPYGIGAAASTRVSNELGAGNPQAAQLAACVVMVLAVTEAVIVGTILFCCRYVLAYAFNSDKDVVNYVSELVPLLSFSIIMDSLQSVLSGVARGTGWQHIGAYVNLGAYYIVGIPLASVLCFVLNLRGKGLWIGIMTGSAVQAIVLAIITVTTNWRKQARMARERIFEGTYSAGNRSV